MFCPRMYHNIRIADNNSVQICGHMVNSMKFNSVQGLQSSSWLHTLKQKLSNNIWPDECIRCQQMEEIGKDSIRTFSIKKHKDYKQINPNYLMVTGIIDNVCNAACISCSNAASTYIGKLSNNVIIVDNINQFNELPKDNILVFELTGGEPSISKNYKKLLSELPNSVRYVRINTNGSKYMTEVERLVDNGTEVTITISMDGIGKIFEYTRWPILWENFTSVLNQYILLSKKYENLHLDVWTTISALNINNLTEIIDFCKEINVPHAYALLQSPDELNVKYSNPLTNRAKVNYIQAATDRDNTVELEKFIAKQDKIRNIDINNYLGEVYGKTIRH